MSQLVFGNSFAIYCFDLVIFSNQMPSMSHQIRIDLTLFKVLGIYDFGLLLALPFLLFQIVVPNFPFNCSENREKWPIYLGSSKTECKMPIPGHKIMSKIISLFAVGPIEGFIRLRTLR